MISLFFFYFITCHNTYSFFFNFSSKIIPGNEEKINDMQEKLIAQGVNVITDKDALVHTSGHCGKSEIRQMYQILRPRVVLPVHGDKKFIREHKILHRHNLRYRGCLGDLCQLPCDLDG